MKNMKKVYLSKRQGFTLIELLIVIAIIGILAGVILVSTNSARQKAQTSNLLQSIKSTSAYMVACLTESTTYAVHASTDANAPVCHSTDALDTAAPGYSVTWPSLTAHGTACVYTNSSFTGAEADAVVTPGPGWMNITDGCTGGNIRCNLRTGQCEVF